MKSQSVLLETEPPFFPIVNIEIVKYPFLKMMHSEFLNLLSRSHKADEARGIALTGESGAGKSTIGKTFVVMYPPQKGELGWNIRVLYVLTPANANMSEFASEILRAMGDPGFKKGNIYEKRFRIEHLIKQLGIQLIILDDIHHILKQTGTTMVKTAEWLTTLFKGTGTPFIIIGIKTEIVEVLALDPQFKRLVGKPKYLEPFEYDNQFAKFVQFAIMTLTPKIDPDLIGKDFPARLYYATDGYIGRIMDVLRDASVFAESTNTSEIRMQHIYNAFEEHWREPYNKIMNPFSTEIPIKEILKEI